MYKKILVPIDGSEGSSLALQHLLGMLENQKPEKVMLFHAVIYPTQLESYSGKMRGPMAQFKEQLLEHGEQILNEAKNRIAERKPGVSVETKLVWGDPKYSITTEADEGKYDLLIMGSRGLSGIKSFLMGSVSNHVAQNVKCTIILVKE
ncbi:MAG: universal stress protein [Bacillota bacterium]